MLSNSCLVLPAVVKQQQEEICRSHVPSLLIAVFVLCDMAQHHEIHEDEVIHKSTFCGICPGLSDAAFVLELRMDLSDFEGKE